MIYPLSVLSYLANQCDEYIAIERVYKFTVTSLINALTQYVDTVITNHATSITPTTTISTIIQSSPKRQLAEENYAPGPFLASEALNETVITSWGRTL